MACQFLKLHTSLHSFYSAGGGLTGFMGGPNWKSSTNMMLDFMVSPLVRNQQVKAYLYVPLRTANGCAQLFPSFIYFIEGTFNSTL